MSSVSAKDVDVEDTVSITSEDNAVAQFEAPREFLQEVRTLVEQLRKCESDPTKGFSQQEKLRKYYYDKKLRHYRKQVGDVLSDCGFPACACNTLENLQLQGYFAEGFDKIKSPYLWKTSRCVLDNVWNYSDASAEFAKDLATSRTLQLMCWNMEHYPNKKPDVKSNQYIIMKATLCILNNIARRPENKHIFKKHKAVKLVFEFKFSHDKYLKVLALTTLACIVDANEAMKLTQDQDTIHTIIHWMNLSIEVDQYHPIKEGFTAAELAYALAKLAIDGNAERIIEGKALKALCRMLNTADMEQQVNAAKCIWTLAFHAEARKSIKTNKELITTLYRLEKEERNRELLENVKGALWVLFEKSDAEPSPVDPTKPKHLFISYCWNEKEAVRKIWQKLRAAGYNVWIDIERMSGDMLEAMSSAVESSSIVIICVSEGYKQSQCCRAEAGYTYKRKKGFIPLLMQSPYEADGWLGAMLGTHLYFDFSCNNEVDFDDSMRSLLKELNVKGVTNTGAESPISPDIPKDDDLGKQSGNAITQRPITISTNVELGDPDAALFATPISISSVAQATTQLNPRRATTPIQALPSPPIRSTPTTTSIARSPNSYVSHACGAPPESYLNMKKADVLEWLKNNDLEQSSVNFKYIDGKLLWQLKCMKAEVPTFFYTLLQNEMELNAISILKFGHALEQLE